MVDGYCGGRVKGADVSVFLTKVQDDVENKIVKDIRGYEEEMMDLGWKKEPSFGGDHSTAADKVRSLCPTSPC